MFDFIGKNMLVKIWNKTIDILLAIKKTNLCILDSIVVKLFKPPYIESIEKTIEKIVREKSSVSRYGDGELKLITGRDISFQKHSKLLEKRLKEVLVSNIENHIVCIPDIFGDNRKYTKTYANEWKNHLIQFRLKWYKNVNKKMRYHNAFISRCYLCFQDINKSRYFFEKIKMVWEKRDVIIIEGEYSRLGVGNDLFNNSKSIKRILGSKKDAFSMYEQIFKFVKVLDKNTLILIALGPSATILSYDLHKEGFQAIDIGHIDVEYEWYLKGATKKIAITNKFVNEVKGGKFQEDTIDEEYFNQIIANFNTPRKSNKYSYEQIQMQ